METPLIPAPGWGRGAAATARCGPGRCGSGRSQSRKGSRSPSASMPPHAPAWINSNATAALIRSAVATLRGSWFRRATGRTYDWLRLELDSVITELLIMRRGRLTRPHVFSAQRDGSIRMVHSWPAMHRTCHGGARNDVNRFTGRAICLDRLMPRAAPKRRRSIDVTAPENGYHGGRTHDHARQEQPCPAI